MREPGTPADHVREDFIFSHIGIFPIQLAGERQPFISVEHVSFSHAKSGAQAAVALTVCELETTRHDGILTSKIRSIQCPNHFLNSAHARRPWETLMRHS